jgi:hypothetical protein
VAPPVSAIGKGTAGELPADLRGRWNWGAFWLPVPWGLSHNVRQPLLVFVLWAVAVMLNSSAEVIGIPAIGPRNARVGPVWLILWPAGIAVGAWCARRGNEWAWANRRFQSAEHFREVQRMWAASAAVLMVLTVVAILVITATGGIDSLDALR